MRKRFCGGSVVEKEAEAYTRSYIPRAGILLVAGSQANDNTIQDLAKDNGLPRAFCAVPTEGKCRGCGAAVDGA